MVTDKNERQVKTGNGLLRFCMNVVGAALVCTGAGGMLLWLSLCMGWWLSGFIAYILWGLCSTSCHPPSVRNLRRHNQPEYIEETVKGYLKSNIQNNCSTN